MYRVDAFGGTRIKEIYDSEQDARARASELKAMGRHVFLLKRVTSEGFMPASYEILEEI